VKSEIFVKYERFQWDKGNSDKNWVQHKVTIAECEQVFFNKPIIVTGDEKHSQNENRWFVLGRTDLDRRLFVVFTTRNEFIRVISARDMNKKEKEIYNEEIKKHSKIQ
jgi:uncharacterized DUF497 family protein